MCAISALRNDRNGKQISTFPKINSALPGLTYSVNPYSDIDLGQLPDGNKPLPESMLTSREWNLWHSPESNFTAIAKATFLYNEFENYYHISQGTLS